jgi:hypothetical protein
MKGKIITFLLGICCCFATTIFASSDQYQVNVLVVEKITAQGLASEVWLPVKKFPNVDSAINPELLPGSCQLNNEAQRFNRMGYRVLINTCWQQAIPITNSAQPIHLFGGDAVSGLNQVDGTLTFNREKYFEVQTNMLLTESDSYLNGKGEANYAAEIADRDPKRFQLKKNFRMRSNELTYVDHPLFGVVIKITPV